MSICKPCADVAHWGCEWPASCPCAHKVPGSETFDLWTYTPIPIVFDWGGHGWVWRATHPDGGESYFDREGEVCRMTFGQKGVILVYEGVDCTTSGSV
jgi:hypothetical protein